MKIGISTVHYAHNYGAMLQGYALKRYCESLGHEVIMTDRRRKLLTKWNPRKVNIHSLKSIILYPKYLCKWYLPSYIPLIRREKKFEKFLNKYLNNTPFSKDDEFDLIIYGSDQIWSKFDYGFNKIWWGYDDLKTKKRISYAASMGIVDIEVSDEAFIREALSHFNAVSVREYDLYNALIEKKMIDKSRIQQVVDPTFLLSKEEWLKITSPRLVQKPYLFFYDFQTDEQTTDIVKTIAKKLGLKIVRATNGILTDDGSDIYYKAINPTEFLSLIYYADFVCTSSFHGTVFSILFEKQFIVRQIWNISRVKTLLKHTKLEGRFVSTQDQIAHLDKIDYSNFSNTMDKIIKKSCDYLKSNMV